MTVNKMGNGRVRGRSLSATVRYVPGRLVEFQLFGLSYPDDRAGLDETLTDVSGAPDPANEATWPHVSDCAN